MFAAPLVDVGFSVAAWTALTFFLGATLYWLGEMLVVGRAATGPIEHDPADVEVRIPTVAAGDVVQATVDALPADFAAVRVIAEEDFAIDDASVHVVPEDFTCEATRKGRALEWARREIPCRGAYVLYLDEDTLLPEFPGLPDADVIQLSERPARSRGWIPYLAEIFRLGFQLEQATFPNFGRPLYAWGGGIAVRKSLEDEVTWDANTVTEDTNFLWRAVEQTDCELQFLDVRAVNQAPPSVREMVAQRRWWLSGAARDSHLLPGRYRFVSLFRNAAWGLVFVSPFLALPFVTSVSTVFLPGVYRAALLVLFGGLLGWALLGYRYYGERRRVLAALVLAIPAVALVHAAGAFWALVQPTTEFRVTEKVPPSEVADEAVAELAAGSEDDAGVSEGEVLEEPRIGG